MRTRTVGGLPYYIHQIVSLMQEQETHDIWTRQLNC